MALGVGSVLDVVFGSSASDILFLRIGLLLVVFAVMFKGLETALKFTRGQAAVAALLASALSMRFMPVAWLQDFGSWIWVLVLFIVPYFLISAVVEKGLVKWLAVAVAYLALFYGLVSYSSYSGGLGISKVVGPIYDILSPVLFLVSDVLRLHGRGFLYLLVGIVIAIAFLAMRKKMKEEAAAGKRK